MKYKLWLSVVISTWQRNGGNVDCTLPTSCTAFSQAFMVNSFRWLRDLKRIDHSKILRPRNQARLCPAYKVLWSVVFHGSTDMCIVTVTWWLCWKLGSCLFKLCLSKSIELLQQQWIITQLDLNQQPNWIHVSNVLLQCTNWATSRLPKVQHLVCGIIQITFHCVTFVSSQLSFNQHAF